MVVEAELVVAADSEHIAQMLQNRHGRQESGGGHIDVQGQPILTRPQTLLVPEPNLQRSIRSLDCLLCPVAGVNSSLVASRTV